jgi:3-oxoacyl-ACP reductase-like protein
VGSWSVHKIRFSLSQSPHAYIDLEKNQHYVAEQLAAGRQVPAIAGGTAASASSALTSTVGDVLTTGRAALADTVRRAKAAAAPPNAGAAYGEAEQELGPEHVPGEL